MQVFQPIQIDKFLNHLILLDKDIAAIIASYEMEKDEIIVIMTEHFREMGIFIVDPLSQPETIKKHLIAALRYSPELLQRRAAIQREIQKAREKNRRVS